MSLKSTNNIETNKHEVVVEVSAEVFNNAVNAVYRKEVKKINIPGFRKGKAPKAIIEKMYGEQVFYDFILVDVDVSFFVRLGIEADILAVDDIGVDRLTSDRIGARLGLILVVGRIEADVVFAELVHYGVEKDGIAVVAGVKLVCRDDIGHKLQDHIRDILAASSVVGVDYGRSRDVRIKIGCRHIPMEDA